MVRKLCFVFWVAFVLEASAQDRYHRNGNEFSFGRGKVTLKIDFCSPSTFRVRTSWDGRFAFNESWMVVRYDFPSVPVKIIKTKTYYLLRSDSLDLKVFLSTGRIDVLTR